MESRPRILIMPQEVVAPRPAGIPLPFSHRWNSTYDGNGPEPSVSVFVTQPAFARLCVHAASEMEFETGGVMIGQWYVDKESGNQFILVETALPARFTRQGSIYLTFTQDTMVAFHTELEEHFPGKKIVGWYHTHPKMGVFLSSYDTWLHNNFFSEPWQVALVIEPHSQVGGFFIRQLDGTLDPVRYSGFHELDGNGNWSIVHWRNLQRVEKVDDEQGD